MILNHEKWTDPRYEKTSALHLPLIKDGLSQVIDSNEPISEVEGPFGFGNAIRLKPGSTQVSSIVKQIDCNKFQISF